MIISKHLTKDDPRLISLLHMGDITLQEYNQIVGNLREPIDSTCERVEPVKLWEDKK